MKKQIIAVLGGDLRKDNKGWHTIRDTEGDDVETTNGGWRVDAGAYLWKDNPAQSVFAMGGRGKLKDVLPKGVTVSSVMKKELISLGVSPEKIIKEKESNNTFGQLKIIVQKIADGDFDKVTVLSNDWHLPRIQAMLEFAPGLSNVKDISMQHITIVSAEEVLLKHDPKGWRVPIEIFMKSKALKARIVMEERGIGQIKNGTYKFL